MVNQPTRDKNVLDLVFSNQPHLFNECSTNILKPQSDHKLVNFQMSNPTTINGGNNPAQTKDRPEFSTFDFRKGDELDW